MTTHVMFDGRLQIYRRGDGKVWQCAARVGGERFRESTHEADLDRAKDVAEEWYLDLRGKLRHGQIIKKEHTFRDAANLYLKDARVLTVGVRSPRYVENVELRLNAHILPFLGDHPLSAINKGLIQAYRVKRTETALEKTTRRGPDGEVVAQGRPPARSTMLQEIVIIRQTLKHAESMGWIPFVPSLSTPYLTQGKKGRRAWFSPEEYKQLYKATRRRITQGTRRGWRSRYEDLHDYVLFMANTGLRPDEALRLEFRDVEVEFDPATGKDILSIDVRGKTGVGFCKSMPGAVHPFANLSKRRSGELRANGVETKSLETILRTTRLFRGFDRDLFNTILREEGLKVDRDGKSRTAYSLRHTYISLRLMEGANIHQIANNCRTSVQMIEEHYASHIKDRLDTAAINVQRPRAVRKASTQGRKRSRSNVANDRGEASP